MASSWGALVSYICLELQCFVLIVLSVHLFEVISGVSKFRWVSMQYVLVCCFMISCTTYYWHQGSASWFLQHLGMWGIENDPIFYLSCYYQPSYFASLRTRYLPLLLLFIFFITYLPSHSATYSVFFAVCILIRCHRHSMGPHRNVAVILKWFAHVQWLVILEKRDFISQPCTVILQSEF